MPIVLEAGEMCREKEYCDFTKDCPGADASIIRSDKFICDIDELERIQNKMKIKNQTFEIIRKDFAPQVLIITPLLPEHKISRETKTSLKRNSTKIVWITSKGQYNTAMNTQLGFDWWCMNNYNNIPKYFIKIDNDVVLGRYMLDRMVESMRKRPSHVAYTYCNFEFKGSMNRVFKADNFDIKRLLMHNYISSNSLFRSDVVEKVGMVTNDSMKRLLDWAFLLKLYYNGYIGVPCKNASFVALSKEKDISNNDLEDYKAKRSLVMEKYGEPIIDRMSHNEEEARLEKKKVYESYKKGSTLWQDKQVRLNKKLKTT